MTRTTVLSCFAGVTMLASTSCRVECAADGPEPASHEQLLREQKAVLRTQGTCKELLTPKVSLVDDRLVLSAMKENVLGHRSDLSTSDTKRVEPLYARLKGYREHFKQVRVAEPFEPFLDVELDPQLESTRAVSLLMTAAVAAYPRMRVRAGEASFQATWWMPPSATAPASALCIEPRGGSLVVRNVGSNDGRDAKTLETPLEALASAITTVCGAAYRCADVLGVQARVEAPFVDVVRIVERALASPPLVAQKPAVVVMTKTPLSGFGALRMRACDP